MPVRIAIGLAVTVICFAVAGRRFHWISRLVRAGQPAPGRLRADRADVARRAEAEITEVAGQRKLLEWTVPGVAHFFTMWGFTILLFTIIEAYGDLFDPTFHIPGIGTSAALGFLEDFFATAVLVALVVFTVIRIKSSPSRKQRASRFYGSHTRAAWMTLLFIFGVIATLLLYRGAQVDTSPRQFPYGDWAFASHVIGAGLAGLGHGVNGALATTFLLLNVSVISAFLVFVSYSKHLHIFVAPFNVAFSRRPRALGGLDKTPDMDMENVTEDTVFGAGFIENFTWKQMLDFVTCTECGRCQSVCPAWTTGKPLSPKLVIMGLRDNMFSQAAHLMAPKEAGSGGEGAPALPVDAGDRSGVASSGPEPLVPGVIEPDVLWSCTTCGSCVEQCPVDIEHVDAIVDMRRYQVLMESSFPHEAELMLRNIENQGDPWGLGVSKRTEWTQVLDFEVPVVSDVIPDDVEYLYWVGCAGALDERARRQVQATARLLHEAGVRFAILGPKESCTGDPARRIGNEYLFQEQAKANIATLESASVRKIVATCPHCFNTLKNEYPALGGNFEVVHHAELLDHLVREGKIVPGTGYSGTVTYHDPCYLGRHNRVFDEPRTVIDAIPGAHNVEMRRCRERGFCCGAGGARMWMEESIGTRVNVDRTLEALGTGADVVSTACPYCMIMLDDAVRANGKEDDVRVLDIAQLVEESMRVPEPAGLPGPGPGTEAGNAPQPEG
ncbi:MAG: (Fe-S)-binding protein [Actinomycetota bacterium]|nr:(Fe-S)-binding protein [Actinomycetota bacterium]